MKSIEELARRHVFTIEPYRTARDDFSGEGFIFLDANELPFLGNERWNRYPDPYQAKIKQLISKQKSIAEKNIFLGNGSDEIIDLLIRLFCEPGQDHITIMPPTYGMYAVCAGVNNVGVHEITLSENFEIDLTLWHRSNSEKNKVLFLCSPNNPTGNCFNRQSINEILHSFSGIVVIDEAYNDFADGPGWKSEIKSCENLVVLQTMSKSWGLAGVRLGMAFASAKIIRLLNLIKLPYNVSGPAQEVIIEALSKPDRFAANIALIIAEREKLRHSLQKFPFVQNVFSSQANFLLVKVTNAADLYRYLLERGTIVRNRSSMVHCDNCLRITIGTSDENRQLLKLLEEYS